MVRLNDGRCVIGFDDGYQLGKTANFIFDNGVHLLGSTEPTLKENSLFYDGEFFKVGEGRSAITDDKVSDGDARLRTMVGIAMELRNAGLHKAEVILAVGLPFSNYGRDKLKLIDYYNQQSVLDFSYEGEDYSVTIAKVIVCPQCYSAIASRLGNMKGDYLVVDIGSFIRFNMEDKADRELYMKLTEGAGNAASLTAYVKRVLEEYFSLNVKIADRQEFHNQMLSVIREEMQLQGMKLVGALLAGIGTASSATPVDGSISEGTMLPDSCESLPDELSGVLDFIR